MVAAVVGDINADSYRYPSGTVDPRQIGVSLGKYTATTASSTAQDTALRTLMANEMCIYIPPGTWTVDAATPFEVLSGQHIFGLAGRRHGIAPTSTALSKLTVPASWNGTGVFNVANGVAHFELDHFLIDLNGSTSSNTADAIGIPLAATAEECQGFIHNMNVFGPFGRGIFVGSGRRGMRLKNVGIYRNGGSAADCGIRIDGTDWVAQELILGGQTMTNGDPGVGVGFRAYGGIGRIIGGDIFGWATGILCGVGSGTPCLGLVLDGVGVDSCGGVGIYVNAECYGSLVSAIVHGNSVQTDSGAAHIRCDALGTFQFGHITATIAPAAITNTPSYVLQFGAGGYANLSKTTFAVKPGTVGASTGKVARTALAGAHSSGTVGYQPVSFSATPTISPVDVEAMGGLWGMTLTNNVTSVTFTANGYDGQRMTLLITQDGTGSRTWAWPSTVINGPTITSTASAVTAVQLRFIANLAKWVVGG